MKAPAVAGAKPSPWLACTRLPGPAAMKAPAVAGAKSSSPVNPCAGSNGPQ